MLYAAIKIHSGVNQITALAPLYGVLGVFILFISITMTQTATPVFRSIRVDCPEQVRLLPSDVYVEVFYGDDARPTERAVSIGDGVVLGRSLDDGEFFTATYNSDGEFMGGHSSPYGGTNFPAEVVEVLTAWYSYRGHNAPFFCAIIGIL